MPVITGVEQLFCMCGPLERKCSYCDSIFRVDPHQDGFQLLSSVKIMPTSLAINMPLVRRDWIKCIFCGNLTWPKDYIKRSAKEIKAERKGESNG